MSQIKLSDNLFVSRIISGQMRLLDWKLSSDELLYFINQVKDIGITTFDHADIYGNYECEAAFGKALKKDISIRRQLQIITKCGIMLKSEKYPERQVKHYDYSYEHIIKSVENSLRNLRTDYIDLLLLHRPSPYYYPEEIASAIYHLKAKGKVLEFGVSNFDVIQMQTLNDYLDNILITNQIELSVYEISAFRNGILDYMTTKKIRPMSWAPLASGRIFQKNDATARRIVKALTDVGKELSIDKSVMIAYAWLLNHPSGIIPVAGSGNFERLKEAAEAVEIKLTTEQWFKIYTASTGENMP